MQTVQFEPVSNREDWIQQCKVFDTSGALSDLTGALIVLTVRERQTEVVKLQAQTSDGSIVIQGIGIFQFTFPSASMHGLDASKQYKVGCTINLNGVTKQFFTGSVPVIDGIVP